MKTVKQYLEATYLNLNNAFWEDVSINPNTLWQDVTIAQLNRISDNLGDTVCEIIDPEF